MNKHLFERKEINKCLCEVIVTRGEPLYPGRVAPERIAIARTYGFQSRWERQMRQVVLFLLVAVLVVGCSSMASASYPYPAPRMYDADGLACDRRHPELNMMADVQWSNRSNGTGFTVLKYSASSSFSNAKYVRPNDLHKYANSARGDTIYRVDGLRAKKRYYFKVAVSTFEGTRRSPYSAVASAVTRSC